MKEWLRHRLNPVHILCRLLDLGMSKRRANRWAKRYEGWVYKWMLG